MTYVRSGPRPHSNMRSERTPTLRSHAFGHGTTGRGKRRLPAPENLPTGRLTPRTGRAWHATAGSLGWSNADYATTRQAYFSAEAADRAARVSQLFESVGLEPTRAGKGVQLPPRQTAAWFDWIGPPVEGVAYKWADTPEEYEDAKRDAEALRNRLWDEREAELWDDVYREPQP